MANDLQRLSCRWDERRQEMTTLYGRVLETGPVTGRQAADLRRKPT
jgi:hypothetical protein